MQLIILKQLYTEGEYKVVQTFYLALYNTV